MLTRLKVHGFKNLLDVDVWFGPFTCVAGVNGVGKSNLFDAITFLRRLAEVPLVEAAAAVRGDVDDMRAGNLRSLFHQTASGRHLDLMRFEVEMVVPRSVTDQLGQRADAASTLLRYALDLRLRDEEGAAGPQRLEVEREELEWLGRSKRVAADHIPFPTASVAWQDSWLKTKQSKRHSSTAVISTSGTGPDRKVNAHQENHGGRLQPRLAATLPRTILSSVSAAESPTAAVARREMTEWRLLQFEPTALRAADHYTYRGPPLIDEVGNHMPAALHGLAALGPDAARSPDVGATVAGRLSELVDDVRGVRVEDDRSQQLLTLYAKLGDGTEHPARSLSDGTLRFLALAIIEQTPQSGGLFCLEEPENGIHPERITAMLDLLRAIATDTSEPVDDRDNPLRQVIVNTHSPEVVKRVPDDSLVIVDRATTLAADGRRATGARFSALPDTWRTQPRGPDGSPLMPATTMGQLLAYLNPISREEFTLPAAANGHRRVLDRVDVRQLLLFAPPQP